MKCCLVLLTMLASVGHCNESECLKIQERQEDGTYIFCCDIKCGPGYVPVMCRPGHPRTSSCKMCPHDKFRNDVSYLSNKDKCKAKTRCNMKGEGLKYTFIGNHTHDAKCGCQSGYQEDWKDDGSLICNRIATIPVDSRKTQHNHTVKSIPGTEQQFKMWLLIPLCSTVGLIIGTILFCRVNKCMNDGRKDTKSTEEKAKCLTMPLNEYRLSIGSLPDLNHKQHKIATKIIIEKKLRTLVKSRKMALKVLKNVFVEMDENKEVIYEDARDVLKEKGHEGLEDDIINAFTKWHACCHNTDPTTHKLIEAIEKAGIKCNVLVNDLKIKLKLF